jgi:hypothetical protein
MHVAVMLEITEVAARLPVRQYQRAFEVLIWLC